MWQVTNQHELLKARLHERGSSFAAVARELGVHPSTVTHVAKRKHKSARIMSALARHAGLEKNDLSLTDEETKVSTQSQQERNMPT